MIETSLATTLQPNYKLTTISKLMSAATIILERIAR